MLMLLLLIAQPSDLDLPKPEKQKRIAAIEARTERTVETSEMLSIEAGDTLFVRASLPVDDARGTLEGRPTSIRASKGIGFSSWIEVVEKQPGAVVVVYGILAAPSRAAGVEVVEAQLEVRDRSGKLVVRKPISHELSVRRPATSAEQIALDRDAQLHHQTIARAAHKKLDALQASLPLDRFVRPPPLAKVPESRLPEYREFLHHRQRAEAAEQRLIAAARSEDPELELAALHALGSLSKGPYGAAKQARALEGLTTDAALTLIERTLDALALDDAEGMLIKLRSGGGLEKNELAVALQLLGAIKLARGDDRSAERAFGQALCLDPGLAPVLGRRAFKEAFASVAAKGLCREPIRIGEVKVARDEERGTLVYRITATYRDDPYGLVESGEVQIWGTGGGMFAADRPQSTEANGQKIVSGSIEDNGKMETYSGQLLVKVFLRDVSGVVIDSYGDPDPIALAIERGENLPGASVPWWVWVLAAGVAVAGAATVTAVVLTKDDGQPPLGIGPIEVTF